MFCREWTKPSIFSEIKLLRKTNLFFVGSGLKGFCEFPSVIVFFQPRFARVVGIPAEGYGKFIDGVKRLVEKAEIPQ